MLINLDTLLLIGILDTLILIWLKLPRQVDAQKRRKRREKIDRIKGKVRHYVRRS